MMDTNNYLLNVSKNVRRKRHEMKLSQEKLAELAGVHRTYVGMVERAEKNITLSSLGKLATALKTDLASLIQEENLSAIIPDNSFYRLINFSVCGDYRGNLVPIEAQKDVPFDIKRVYYIWGAQKDITRGQHAYHKLDQVVVCVSGACDFILDNGKKKETVHLSSPNQGLYIKHNVWREFTNFSSDCVVLVLASDHYDESDCIKDYQAFLKETANGQ